MLLFMKEVLNWCHCKMVVLSEPQYKCFGSKLLCSHSLIFDSLIELRKLNVERRNFILISCGANLIHAFSELFLNIIKHSNPKNLTDKTTIRLIKKYFTPIGQIISPQNSVKIKKNLLLKDRNLQNLALFQALGGYESFRKSKFGQWKKHQCRLKLIWPRFNWKLSKNDWNGREG